MEHRGALLAMLAGLCYGLVGFFGMSIIKADCSVSAMLFWRFFVSSLFMAVVLIPKYRTLVPIDRQSIQAFLYGMLFYGTSTTLYFIASLYIGTGLAMVIFFTFPAFVMLINAAFYKVVIRKIYYLALALMTFGLAFLVNPENISLDLYGIALSVLCAGLYGCYIAASKRISVPPMLSTFMVSLGCMTASLLFALFDSSLALPQSFSCWIDIIAMGLICTAIPILLLLQCFTYISSEKASMLTVLEPVFVVIFGILLLDEEMTAYKLSGIIIILSGALITLLSDKAKEIKEN
ncbi:MAG: DMT family transporter [Verrucomicrobia bacterium]|nr:DMT family transporter [Verrucomicrobiota bacterium]